VENGNRHLTFFAALLSMVAPFSINTYLPSFPDIELEFGISRVVLSQSLAVYLMAFAVSTLFWGPVADRLGRRAVILLSMALYGFASVGCAVSQSAETFLFFRVMQGLTASGGVVAARAMIRDANNAADARRAMAQVMLYFAAAPAVAPVLGGWLHEFLGWRSVFWFLAGFGGLLVLMGLATTETLSLKERTSIHPIAVIRAYVGALRHRQFMMLVLCWSLGFAGFFLYVAGAPTVIYGFLGLGANEFGWLFIPIVSGLILGAYISNRIPAHWPPASTISIGLAVMFVGALVNLITANLASASIPAVIGPLLFYVTGFALTIPALTVLSLDCLPANRGTASSMQGFAQMMAGSLVASFAVPLLSGSWVHFALGQALFLIVSIGLWYRLRKSLDIPQT
jgi:DHA1 family bicyclomycin/chloramphenicol resistance-like MFS transporter